LLDAGSCGSTVWQNEICDHTINEYIKNIFSEGEVVEADAMKKFGISEFQKKIKWIKGRADQSNYPISNI